VKIKKYLTFLAVVLYIVIIYFTPPSYINRPKLFFLKIARFPLTLTTRISYNINRMLSSKHLIDENISLNKTVDALTRQLVKYKDIESENLRLNKLLAFKQKSNFKLLAARIISKDPANLSKTIVIDQGKEAGIEDRGVVISEAGLVGHIAQSQDNISRVILITDPNSRISATVLRTRQLGVLYGTSTSLCKLRYLSLSSDIKVGDEIVTSGFSDIYPKGLLIGKVVKVIKEPRGLSLSALIKPAVDLSKLEEVLCIK